MPGPIFARDDDVTLRTIEREDVEFLQENRMNPAIRRPMRISEVENREQMSAFFEEYISSEEDANLLVCRESTSTDAPPTPVGMATLFDIDELAGTAELAVWTSSDVQDNGYATSAAGMMLDYGFAERRLHKVYGRVHTGNEGAARVLEKLGFEEEGLLRDQEFVHGEYRDTHFYGILVDEWIETREE